MSQVPVIYTNLFCFQLIPLFCYFTRTKSLLLSNYEEGKKNKKLCKAFLCNKLYTIPSPVQTEPIDAQIASNACYFFFSKKWEKTVGKLRISYSCLIFQCIACAFCCVIIFLSHNGHSNLPSKVSHAGEHLASEKKINVNRQMKLKPFILHIFEKYVEIC